MSNKTYRPHFTSTTDARVLRTREALRQAIYSLLATKPLDQITIPEITKLAGIGRTSFFRHYPSKEALLEEVAIGEIRQLVAKTLPQTEIDDPREVSLALFTYVAKNKKQWRALLEGGAASTMNEEFIRIAHNVSKITKTRSAWLPPEAGIVIVVSSTIELIAWWLRQKRPLSVDKIATVYERAVLAPIYVEY